MEIVSPLSANNAFQIAKNALVPPALNVLVVMEFKHQQHHALNVPFKTASNAVAILLIAAQNVPLDISL